MDANARLPCDVCGITGGVVYGDPDDCGAELVLFLQKHSLYAPSTFETLHHGPSFTWQHARGHLSRIDHVLVRASQPVSREQSWVSLTFDALTSTADHWCVAWQGEVAVHSVMEECRQLHRPKFDRQRLLSSEGRDIVRDELRAIVSPAWDLHPDEHAEFLASSLRRVLHKHFLTATDGPKALYITSCIWEARNACLRFKKRTRRWNEGLGLFLTATGFQTWKTRQSPPCRLWKVLLLREVYAAAVKFANGRVKIMIRREKQCRFNGFLRSLGGLKLQDLQKALRTFGIGGRRNRQQRRPAPQLKRPDGTAIVGRGANDQAWLAFFGEQEGGEVVEVDVLLEECRTSEPPVIDELDPSVLPSLREVEHAFRTTASHKAFGLDCLPPEIFAANPAVLASLYLPLFAKCALRCYQPSQWRGGLLYSAYKGKGSCEELASYRSLFVGSMPSKALHKIYRGRLQGTVHDTLHEWQCGVTLGKPVTLPSLCAHLIVRRLFRSKQSMAAFFLDIRTAYYSTVREIALGCYESDEMVARVFHRFGLQNGEATQLMELIQSGGVLSAEGIGPHMLEILRDLYKRSWFATPLSDGTRVCRTAVGTRPGSNFADLVFAFVYHRLWTEIRQHAQSASLDLEIPHTGAKVPWADASEHRGEILRCLDATWADDSVAFSADSEPGRMISKANGLVRTVLEGCGRFGLTPNLKKGKSALLLALRGKGSRQTAAAHFASDSRTLKIEMQNGTMAEVCVEGAYLHLGTILDRDGKMLGEARRVLARAAGAFNESREKIFQNEFLSLKDRATVFNRLVQATIFNLELWTEHEPSWALLRDGFHRLQKRLLAKQFRDEAYFSLAHAEVMYRTGLMDLDNVARRKRLGFFAGLVRRGGNAVWAVIQWEDEWGRQLQRDLDWFSAWTVEELPARTTASWPLWWHFLSGNPATLKSKWKQAAWRCRHAWLRTQAGLLFLHDAYRVRFGRQQIALSGNGRVWCCPPCQRSFKTKSALGAHFKAKHNRVANYRFYGHGSNCSGCGKAYHSHDRLLMHLKHSVLCRAKMSAAGLRSAEPAAGVRTWKKTRVQDFVLCPPEVRHEPLKNLPDDDVLWNEQPLLQEAFQKVLDGLVPSDYSVVEEYKSGVVRLLGDFPLHEFEFRVVLGRLVTAARHLIEEEEMNLWCTVGHRQVILLLESLRDGLSSESFLPAEFQECRELKLDETILYAGETWTCTAAPLSGITLLVQVESQGTSCSATTVLRPIDALVSWNRDGWHGVGRIIVRLPSELEEVGYLGVRAEKDTSLRHGDPGVYWKLLVAAACFKGRGGAVAILACSSFWSTSFAIPFRV